MQSNVRERVVRPTVETKMANNEKDDVRIPVFDGSEYSSWKARILLYLRMKKCKVVVERRQITTGNAIDDAADREVMDVKAMNYICGSVTNKQFEYVKHLQTAYDMIKKFDEMHLKESTALQILKRNDLERIKLKDFSKTTNFFDEFEKAVNELKAAGATIEDKEVLNYMLKALPSEYSYIGDVIDVLPEQERTVEYLKSKIQMKTMQKNEEENYNDVDQVNSSAFNTQTKYRPTCYSCN